MILKNSDQTLSTTASNLAQIKKINSLLFLIKK